VRPARLLQEPVLYQEVVDRLTHVYGARNARPRRELLQQVSTLVCLLRRNAQCEHNVNA
jgi:hypothetical protein